jgi:hypothetical protein
MGADPAAARMSGMATFLTMDASAAAHSKPVPVHVGLARPKPSEEQDATDARPPNPLFHRRRSPLEDLGFDWASYDLEPRWLAMETSDCAAALDPSIYHNRGASELERFLTGAAARNETALIIATIGDVDDHRPRPLMATADATVSLPGVEEYIAGARLPDGALASLASDLGTADRDLGLRLLNGRPADAPWWSLTLHGSELHPGDGGPIVRYEATGQLEPILIDGLGHPVVAAWTPASGDQRWYIVPDVSDWHGILDWLLERALPEYVPGALRRARSPLAHDPALQTRAEAAARLALDDLVAGYAQERGRLEAQLEEARAEAEPMRNGLLYGTGSELEQAVATVLEAAGFAVVSLDELLGDTTSADLLASYGLDRRLVEIKSASGNAGESLVGQLDRHLQTWPQLRPGEPVGGGVLVVNHQHRLEPAERTPSVYLRQEFIATLTVPVLSTRQLFDWWRDSDWATIREAVLAQKSGQPHEEPGPNTRKTLASSPSPESSEATTPAGGWRRLFGRLGSE